MYSVYSVYCTERGSQVYITVCTVYSVQREEGVECKHEGCGQSYENFQELETHCKDHQDELRKAAIVSSSQVLKLRNICTD